ncbi:lactadherin-like [Patiria miniata]|uniref:Uncharacterized protein n=1 Tax=Patiria miniata TaxID=46514 RepID=A0A914BNQ1_PATMI|nr:lactadherin-like [Patiria miniata]
MAESMQFVYRERTFIATEQRALLHHTIGEFASKSPVRCSVSCLTHAACRSFNFGRVSRVCQLSDAGRNDFPKDFQLSGDFTHFEAEDLNGLGVQTTAQYSTSAQSTEADVTTLTTGDCNSENDGAMGMASGLIPDSKISASSINTGYSIHWARINDKGWCALNHDANQWLQVDFGGKVYVTGVQCGSYYNGNAYIDEYKVLYGDDGVAWTTVQNEAGTADAVFDGPPDRDTVVTSMFPAVVYARYIRLQPTAWPVYVCMRFELLGCRY